MPQQTDSERMEVEEVVASDPTTEDQAYMDDDEDVYYDEDEAREDDEPSAWVIQQELRRLLLTKNSPPASDLVCQTRGHGVDMERTIGSASIPSGGKSIVFTNEKYRQDASKSPNEQIEQGVMNVRFNLPKEYVSQTPAFLDLAAGNTQHSLSSVFAQRDDELDECVYLSKDGAHGVGAYRDAEYTSSAWTARGFIKGANKRAKKSAELWVTNSKGFWRQVKPKQSDIKPEQVFLARSTVATEDQRLKNSESSAHLVFRNIGNCWDCFADRGPEEADSIYEDHDADATGSGDDNIRFHLKSLFLWDSKARSIVHPMGPLQPRAEYAGLFMRIQKALQGKKDQALESHAHFLTPLALLHVPQPHPGRSTLLTCLAGNLIIWVWRAVLGTPAGRLFDMIVIPTGRTITLHPDMPYSLMALDTACFMESAVFDHTPDLLKYYRKHLLLADSGLSYKRFLRPELLASGAMDHFRLNTQSPFDEGLLLLLPGIWGVIKQLWDSASDDRNDLLLDAASQIMDNDTILRTIDDMRNHAPSAEVRALWKVMKGLAKETHGLKEIWIMERFVDH